MAPIVFGQMLRPGKVVDVMTKILIRLMVAQYTGTGIRDNLICS